MPRVSVLTPSFNYARFLGAGILSVAVQGGDIEHIVQDGGSTDGTQELLKRYSLQFGVNRLRYTSVIDRGQSDALNRALAHSTGSIIGWLNADDAYLPGAVDRAVAELDGSGADVVYGDVVLIDEHGMFIRLVVGYPFAAHVLRYRGCVIPSASSFFRRSALGESPWDISLREIMDWDLFLGLERSGHSFRYVRRPLAVFRIHEAQVTFGGGDGNDAPRRMVRQRHNAAPRMFRVLRYAGTLSHKARKIIHGADRLERRALAELGGTHFMGPEGVAVDVFDRLLRLYDECR